MWADKYVPKDISEIAGNQQLIKHLHDWLSDWNKVHLQGLKKSI